MKITLPSFLATFGSLTLLASPLAAQVTTYEVDVANTPSSKNWTASATWIGSPSSYPSTSSDEVLFPSYTASRTLNVDLDEATIGAFRATTGAGTSANLLYAAASQTAALTIGTLEKTGASTLSIANGTSGGSLSVTVDQLTIGSGSTLDVGRDIFGSLAAFTVTGTSTINGYFNLSGIANQAAGLNRVQLGALQVNGNVLIGGRGNQNGVIEVNSLTGTGQVLLTNATHKGAQTTGTLVINSTNLAPVDYEGTLVNGISDDGYFLAVVKKGNGVQILSSDSGSSYTGGTVIEGGVLAVSTTSTGNGVSGLGRGAVEVRDGGTLAGNGRIRLTGQSTVVKSGGIIAPSAHLASGVATLTFNGTGQSSVAILSLDEGAAFRFRLDAEDVSDRVEFINYHDGGLVLPTGGVTLYFDNAQEGTFTLFGFNSIQSSELEALSQSLTFNASGFEGTFGYDDRTIFVEVTAIPEPATTALVFLGLAAAGLKKWRGTATECK